MNVPIFVILGSQLLFSISDIMGRIYMPRYGFNLSAFLTPWFLIYMVIRTFATLGQLYVFVSVELGKSIALFGAAAIIFANLVGVLLLKEVLSVQGYIGVVLAVMAFVVLAMA